MNDKRIVIADVAKKANISKTTVSRYLNGKYESMSAETRLKIQEVIKELNYRPSNIARSLKSRKSGLIGCVIADITSPFSSYLVKGVNDVCKKKGYQVMFVNTDNQKESELESIDSLLDNKLEGLIVNTTGYNDEYLIDIHENGMPIVMADRTLKNKYLVDTITTENYHSTFNCIKFLHNQGYDKVAFFTEDPGEISSRIVRYNGYIDAMAKLYTLDGNKYKFLVDSTDLNVCMENLKIYKEENPDENLCIFAVNGVTLLNVLSSMANLGYMPGEDFGICGFDDWGWASLIPPGITTLTQDSYKTGVMSAELMVKRIEKGITPEKKYVELPTKLVVRGSTTIKPKDSKDVSK